MRKRYLAMALTEYLKAYGIMLHSLIVEVKMVVTRETRRVVEFKRRRDA